LSVDGGGVSWVERRVGRGRCHRGATRTKPTKQQTHLNVALRHPTGHGQRGALGLGDIFEVAQQVAARVPELVGEVAVGLHPVFNLVYGDLVGVYGGLRVRIYMIVYIVYICVCESVYTNINISHCTHFSIESGTSWPGVTPVTRE
jgi:hypothetical protein